MMSFLAFLFAGAVATILSTLLVGGYYTRQQRNHLDTGRIIRYDDGVYSQVWNVIAIFSFFAHIFLGGFFLKNGWIVLGLFVFTLLIPIVFRFSAKLQKIEKIEYLRGYGMMSLLVYIIIMAIAMYQLKVRLLVAL